MQPLTSASNKQIKFAKKLITDKKCRDSSNMFVAQTYRVIKNLIDQKFKLVNVFVTNESKYLNEFKTNTLTRTINASVFRSLSGLKNSDGLIAIFEKKEQKLDIKKDGKYLVLNKIQNPGNLGTIIRTACAFSIDGIFITNDSVDLYNIETIRNTMGYIGIVPIKNYYNYFDAIASLQKSGIKVYATALNDKATDINKINLSKSFAVVLGNEGNGLNHKEIRACDQSIYIKTNPNVESLNVAIAAGIILSKIN